MHSFSKHILEEFKKACASKIFRRKNMSLQYDIVVFTNKRSQAKVFTVYLSLAEQHSYLEDDNYKVTLFTWSAESINIHRYLYTLGWSVEFFFDRTEQGN